MKKKIFLLTLIFLFPLIAFCDEIDEFDRGYDAFTRARNLKPVSEQEVQQALKQLEDKKRAKTEKKKHWWSKNKKDKKIDGTPLQNGLKSNDNSVMQRPYLLVQIAYNLINNNALIPQGFYTVDFDESTSTLLLKQGYNIIASIKMARAQKEPDFEELYYIKTVMQNNGIKFIYGAVDKHYEGFCRILN